MFGQRCLWKKPGFGAMPRNWMPHHFVGLQYPKTCFATQGLLLCFYTLESSAYIMLHPCWRSSQKGSYSIHDPICHVGVACSLGCVHSNIFVLLLETWIHSPFEGFISIPFFCWDGLKCQRSFFAWDGPHCCWKCSFIKTFIHDIVNRSLSPFCDMFVGKTPGI